MDASDQFDHVERQRLDADARYNDALTAFDRVIASCRGRVLGVDETEQLLHALIIFLQQITAFVDTKDRALAAEMQTRVEGLERRLSDIDELRTRLAVLQRQVRASTQAPIGAPQLSPVSPAPAPAQDVVYVAFEDQFRGSDEAVTAKVNDYVPIFAGASDVIDLGCGRGEFLAALRSAGIRGRGVDTNAEMVAIARERGLDVELGDALSYLRSIADESIGGAIATQVVEHLAPPYLFELVTVLARKLRAGAPLVLETINPACWLAFFSSYLRDLSHVRPIHPDTLQYLLRATGFERVQIRYSAPVPDEVKMKSVHLPADVLAASDPIAAGIARTAHAVNANAAILNSFMFTHLDYAAVGYRA